MDRAGEIAFDEPAEGFEIGLVLNIANGAAQRTGAIERALRAAQHLDPGQIEGNRLGSAAISGADADRRLVEIDTDRGVAGGGADAADLQLGVSFGAAGLYGEAGHGAGQIVDSRDCRTV